MSNKKEQSPQSVGQKTFNYSGNNKEGNPKIESNEMISRQWNFKHELGCIHVETWGKPFLVLLCNSYSDYGESWGYNYEKTGIEFDTVEECQKRAKELNSKYAFPRYFNFSVQAKDLDLNTTEPEQVGHTPGNWIASEVDENGGNIVSSEGWHIAKINPFAPEASNSEANARLIAAAPRMYAALQNLIERDIVRPDDGDHFHEIMEVVASVEGWEYKPEN